MTATIHRFPIRQKPRPVDPRGKILPQLTEDHFERELREIARRLHEATGHFGMLLTEPVGQTAITEGCIALQAALFHALTLDGCRNETMPLRQLLLSMHMKRMEA